MPLTSDPLPPGEGSFYIKLDPPPPSTAEERRLWDVFYRSKRLSGVSPAGSTPSSLVVAPDRVTDEGRIAPVDQVVLAHTEPGDADVPWVDSPTSSTDSSASPRTPAASVEDSTEGVDENARPEKEIDYQESGHNISASRSSGSAHRYPLGSFVKTDFNFAPPRAGDTRPYFRLQTYTVAVDVPPDLVKEAKRSTWPINVGLLMDTGSSTTWLFGWGNRKPRHVECGRCGNTSRFKFTLCYKEGYAGAWSVYCFGPRCGAVFAPKDQDGPNPDHLCEIKDQRAYDRAAKVREADERRARTAQKAAAKEANARERQRKAMEKAAQRAAEKEAKVRQGERDAAAKVARRAADEEVQAKRRQERAARQAPVAPTKKTDPARKKVAIASRPLKAAQRISTFANL
ncbi:hypothetical protein BV20DRAFT_983823 [Pilatotrama ljubarskyi]|nr:hypothetical protein BV20DRAFT_983823 [Pilatotrama ljubarskyi]